MPDLFPSPLVILELDSIANIIHEQGVQGFDPRSTDDHYPTSSTHGNDTTPIRERRLKPIATKRVYSIRGTWRAVCIGAGGNWALAVCDDHLQLWDIGNYEDSCAGTVIASLPIGVANESSIFLQWDLVNSASSGGTMVGLSEEEEESIPGSKHSIFHIDWTGQPTITYVFSHETIEASDLRVHSSGLPLINEQGRTTYIWDIRSGFKEENAVVLRAEEWADECVIYDKFLLRFTLPITGVVEIFRLPFPLTTQPDHTSVSSESYLLGTYNWIEDAETDIKYGRAFKCARSFTRSPQIGEDDQPTAIFFVCAEYALDVTIVWQKGVYLPSDELGTPQVSTLRRIVRGSPFSGDRFPAYPILEIGHASWLWWLNSDQELATIGTEIATYVAEFGDKDDQGRTSVAHEHSALLDLGSIKPSGLLNWNSVDFDVHSGRIVAPDRNILYIFDYV
ncbi:hypothetical protein DL96DRAFT_1613375 [Flagelloscypha sp. PMI_526]|nr:hypothetical protein DL96DRAFT_1613375 [Flagelloscypha sp. PMI_526]